MQALVTHSYGSPDVLQIEELPTPTVREEVLLLLWLLVKGVNVEQWNRRALEAASI